MNVESDPLQTEMPCSMKKGQFEERFLINLFGLLLT